MASDRMMEYYYSMGQDCLHTGSIDDAVTYFRKAANLGAREAAEEICQIGEKLEKGEGVSKDEVKAENCWKIASSYDISRANLLLGRMYMKGINGGKPNPTEAPKLHPFWENSTTKACLAVSVLKRHSSTTSWQPKGATPPPC